MGGIGSGGHNRLTAEAHVLRGTFRPDRHASRPARLDTASDLPRAPARLHAGGRRLWEGMTAQFEFAAGELAILEQACRTVDLIAELREPGELRAQRLVLLKLLTGLRLQT